MLSGTIGKLLLARVYHNNMILLFSSSVDYQMLSSSRVNWLSFSLSLSLSLPRTVCAHIDLHINCIDQCLIYTLLSIVNTPDLLIRRKNLHKQLSMENFSYQSSLDGLWSWRAFILKVHVKKAMCHWSTLCIFLLLTKTRRRRKTTRTTVRRSRKRR